MELYPKKIRDKRHDRIRHQNIRQIIFNVKPKQAEHQNK